MQKRCRVCGREKPRAEYYAHPQMADGLLSRCKECHRAAVLANRRKRIDYYRAMDRARGNEPARVALRAAYATTVAGRAAHGRAVRADHVRNPEKRAARIATDNALRDGRLKREPCEVCGARRAYAHHDDYSRPLMVRWLCAAHHRSAHERER